MVALSLPFEPVFIDAEWPFVKIPAVWGHGQATELRKGKRRKRGWGNSPAAISSVVAKRILLNHSNRGRPSQALANLNVLFAGRLSKLAASVARLR
jgi:hypothetical protein